MLGTNEYCRAIEENRVVPKPTASADDVAVSAYLSCLHHRLAHARIANDAKLQATILAQTQEFKLGNAPWQDMYVRYFYYYWDYAYHEGGAPEYRSWQDPRAGRGDLSYGVIEWQLPSRARIAIIGDIGTGTDQAAAVLSAAISLKPDAFLHVGDVYYSGTRFEMRHRLVELVETVCRFSRRRVPFFTVPGNHEYFVGAKPFLSTLDSGSLVDRATQRQRASYFALRSEDDGWQFLGLDTGFFGHYMNVAGSAAQATLERLHLGPPVQAPASSDPYWPSQYNPYFPGATGPGITPTDPTSPPPFVTVRPDELVWHEDKLKQFMGRSVLLSHHQLYSALNICGVAQKQITGSNGTTSADPGDYDRLWINTGLWRQFGEQFGVRIAAWLWGHEHNLGIYADNYRPTDWPTSGSDAEMFRPLPKGRCVGHGAIPVAESEAPYAARYPVPLKDPTLMLGVTNGWYNRGFELIELAGAGAPLEINYYQIAGADPTPLLVYHETVA